MQGLELLVRLVGFLGRGDHVLYLLDDGQFLLHILLLLLFLLAEQLLALLLDNAHLGFEGLLVGVGEYLVLLWVAAAVDICFQACLALSNVHFVEDGLQVVYLILLGCLLVVRDFAHALQNLLLVLVLFALSLRRLLVSLYGLLGCVLHYVLFYVLLLYGNLFLRVHHQFVLK